MSEQTNKPKVSLGSASSASQRKSNAPSGVSLPDNRDSTSQLKNLTHQEPVKHAVAPNVTGLPNNLKSGMESLSGMSLDHVKVHYNSSKPAAVQAHAYAQGSDIHLASGQEQHLPHELGHVVQQAQGRVKPSTTVNGMPVNDNQSLESEATVMGNKALQMHSKNTDKTSQQFSHANKNLVQQFKSMENHGLEGVGYSSMSKADYGQWKNTVQCKSTMHGVAEHGGQVFITQFLNPKEVMQQASFLGKAKGWLVALEGVLAIAAGIALTTVTAGVAAIPGIIAIIVGVMKIIRGLLMIYDGKQQEHSDLRKFLINTLRFLESFVAIMGGAVASNPALLVFGVAKVLRSMVSYLISDKEVDKNSIFNRVLHGISAGLHVVEVVAGGFSGISGMAGTGAATATVVGGALNTGVAASKGLRSADGFASALPPNTPATTTTPLLNGHSNGYSTV